MTEDQKQQLRDLRVKKHSRGLSEDELRLLKVLEELELSED